MSIDDLKKPHESYPRNEDIATIFYKRGWVEGWGTGTLRMIGYCEKNDTPEPEFSEYSSGFAVTFRFKESMSTVPKSTHALQPALTARQEQILTILGTTNTMSATEIQGRLSSKTSLRTVQADLTTLKNTALVEQIGKGPTTLWKKR